ncbi:nucleotidyltransferase domain-containing protein [Mycolicibacterium sp. XJ775]
MSDDLPPHGRAISADEADRLWAPWTPAEVAERLTDVDAPWCVAAGWAIDLYLGGPPRSHADIEIAVPRHDFGQIADALAGFEWDVAGDGRLWSFSDVGDHPDLHQTWCRDPATGRYHLDVFREPHDSDRWVFRRDPSITLPYDELIQVRDGIPYVIPEVALLFKAHRTATKDEDDFSRVAPRLAHDARTRLSDWLTHLYPAHPWLNRLHA